ncbi:hypothetical protein CWI39_2083p0010 [Hamiltosporidium magnivora]|uniref:Macro domain-containing protein n=1 Tax=Hamiltosporidium magnivora TaxID=148818 RepID=A0A4Q9KWK2_9MICR|nr:hypothetical protein CWI39_2083p0010 [Hamiltosporidium magnivora]
MNNQRRKKLFIIGSVLLSSVLITVGVIVFFRINRAKNEKTKEHKKNHEDHTKKAEINEKKEYKEEKKSLKEPLVNESVQKIKPENVSKNINEHETATMVPETHENTSKIQKETNIEPDVNFSKPETIIETIISEKDIELDKNLNAMKLKIKFIGTLLYIFKVKLINIKIDRSTKRSDLDFSGDSTNSRSIGIVNSADSKFSFEGEDKNHSLRDFAEMNGGLTSDKQDWKNITDENYIAVKRPGGIGSMAISEFNYGKIFHCIGPSITNEKNLMNMPKNLQELRQGVSSLFMKAYKEARKQKLDLIIFKFISTGANSIGSNGLIFEPNMFTFCIYSGILDFLKNISEDEIKNIAFNLWR